MKLRSVFLAGLLLTLGLLSVTAVHAQQAKPDANKGAVKQLQQRLRSTEQAKLAAEAKLTEVSAEVEKAAVKAQAIDKKRATAEKEARVLREQVARLTDTLAATETRLATTEQELAATAANLAARERGLASAQDKLTRTSQELQVVGGELTSRILDLNTCNGKNRGLKKTAESILQKFQDKTCTVAVLEKERVTGLKRVALENQVDEYREQMERDLTAATLEAQRQEALRTEAQKKQAIEAEKERELEQQKLAVAERRKQQFTQQKSIDKLSRDVREFFEGIEW
jgi:chromosome segregation ATPase